MTQQPKFSDLVIVEIAGSQAGAYASKLFGDLGAQVVCLEPPEGAPLRADPAKWAAWVGTRNVVSIECPEAQIWMDRADVVISSSDVLPLREESICVRVPDTAIKVAISPFGSHGPYASWTGADIVDQAIGGHLFLSGVPDREPLQGPSGQAALAAGVYGAIGAMAALHARRLEPVAGFGQRVEVSHHETLASLHQFTDVRFTHAANVLKRMGNRYAGPGSPIGMYHASDGSIALTIATGAHFEMLLAVTGLQGLLDHPDVTSITDLMVHPSLFEPAFNEWLSKQTVAETVELFQSARLAAGPVLTMQQLLEDPHLEARDWWRCVDADGQSVRIPGPPFRISGMPDASSEATSHAPKEGRSAQVPRPVQHADVDPLAKGLSSRRPLDGLRVLDLTRVWAGPLAARILGELGADVVMLEAPWGRTPLAIPASYVQASHFFPNDDPLPHPWNRNGFVNKFAIEKRSLALDITTPEGHDVLERLIPNIDVLIENYSPRVMPNLGFTEERLRELNPNLIYVTMPGYGRTGPSKDYSAYGPVLDSHAGLSSLMGYEGMRAWKCGIAWPDPVAGIHAAFAVLAALWERGFGDGATGGTTIEVAQFETAVSMIADRLIRAQLEHVNPEILGNRHPFFAPQGVYPAQGDDAWLALTVIDDANWKALCTLTRAPIQWIERTQDERHEHHDEIDEALRIWSQARSAPESARLLQSVGIAAAPVADGAMLMGDPHLRERRYYVDVEHPEAGTQAWGRTCAASLSGTPSGITRPAPCLGQHNHEILRDWAGLSDGAIAELHSTGTLATRPPL